MLGHVDAAAGRARAGARWARRRRSTSTRSRRSDGITLDLGGSSFTVDLPDQLAGEPYDGAGDARRLPAHASLIRTVIGGAQIIDLMMLVIDAYKGIQTQTAECLVIGEITNDNLIVVLNKLDLLPTTRGTTRSQR